MDRRQLAGLFASMSYMLEAAAEALAEEPPATHPPDWDAPRPTGPEPDVDKKMAGVIDTLARAGIGRTTWPGKGAPAGGEPPQE